MRRITRLPRLGVQFATTVAALATGLCGISEAQQAGLPTPPPVTAVGPQDMAPRDVILTGLRPRHGMGVRTANAGHANTGANSGNYSTQPQPPAAPVSSAPLAANPASAPAAIVAGVGSEQFYAQLDTAIEVSSRRFLTANVHSPWQIFHGLLALKQDFQLNLGTGRVNAIQWIATSEPRFDNQPLLLKTPHGGKFHSFTRPYAFEGHPAQFLALLSQSDLPVGYQFKVGTGHITLGDIINNTMKEVNNREEVTWVLWGLQHYLKPDAQWMNQHNEHWSIERLVQIETAAPVVGAPCGGNHRLFALTRTRDKHLKHGGQLVGIWAQADHKIRQHIEIARSLQNYDGSFSAKFYETSGHTTDLNSRFNTTGHTMEFLSIALPNDRLLEPWVQSAVTALCNDLIMNRQRNIDCGPLYHTLNSLIIYRERIRPMRPVVAPPAVAQTVPPVGKPNTTPSASNPTNVTTSKPATTNIAETTPIDVPVNTNTVTTEKKSDLPMPNGAALPLPPVKPQPSAEALNELKLDGEFREKLNSLTGPRPLPAIVPPNTEAKPLESSGQPVLQAPEEPASALTPENKSDK